MYGYIYMTTCLINGKGYVGKHKGEFDPNYLGSGKLIRRAVGKYGKDNFYVQLLCTADTEEELNELEKYFVDALNCVHDDHYYNLMEGGHGGKVYLDEESQQAKISKAVDKIKAFYESNEGKRFKERLRELKTGVKYPDEVNKKKGSKGVKNPNYGNKFGHVDQDHPRARGVRIITPDGNSYEFECLKFAVKWAKETLDMGRGTLIQLLKTGEPYDSWQRKKYHLKGLKAMYIEDQKKVS